MCQNFNGCSAHEVLKRHAQTNSNQLLLVNIDTCLFFLVSILLKRYPCASSMINLQQEETFWKCAEIAAGNERGIIQGFTFQPNNALA
jgi:hypothetical protein